MAHWISNYIGIPRKLGGRDADGVDCWGLLYLVYQEHFHQDIPCFPGLDTGSIWKVHQAVLQEIPSRWMELENPVDGCAVALSQRRAIHHVGIWVDADGGKVVHCEKMSVVAETIRSLRRKGYRIIKFYGLRNCYS